MQRLSAYRPSAETTQCLQAQCRPVSVPLRPSAEANFSLWSATNPKIFFHFSWFSWLEFPLRIREKSLHTSVQEFGERQTRILYMVEHPVDAFWSSLGFENCRFYNFLGFRPTNLQYIYKIIYIYKTSTNLHIETWDIYYFLPFFSKERYITIINPS